jgi:L-ascorbate metabolism protein UlaG (beta-lactamase superfamily)
MHTLFLMIFTCLLPGAGQVNPALQTGPLPEVYPIAHATAVLNWGGTIVYIDPVGGAEAFAGQPAPDLMLVTDLHGDHYDATTLQALKKAGTQLVAPQAVQSQMPPDLRESTRVLENGATLEIAGVQITAIPMYNLREEAQKFHQKGRGNGYVLEKGGVRVYFSGDTEDIPEMRALQDIDLAFVCMNLPYTMTVEKAADAVLAFKPRKVYPYHYRGNPEVSDVKRFAELVHAGNPDIEVVQLDWYPADPF